MQGVTLVESGPIQPATSNSTCRNGGSSESRAPGSCGEVGEHGGSVGSVAAFDPLRLVVNASGLGVTGFEAAEWLESRHGIVPELATVKVSGGQVPAGGIGAAVGWGGGLQHLGGLVVAVSLQGRAGGGFVDTRV